NAVDPATKVRYVLLSPIRHEDLRSTRPGLPDPSRHNALLDEYNNAIEALALERGARFVSTMLFRASPDTTRIEHVARDYEFIKVPLLTENGIHPNERGYRALAAIVAAQMGWGSGKIDPASDVSPALRSA